MAPEFQRAVRALNQGRLDTAAGACRALLEQEPDNVDAIHLLGVIECEAGQLEAGERRLKQAIRARPDDPEIFYNYASALLKHGRFEQALALYDRALALDPGHVSACNNRGTALKQLGLTDEARASYSAALKLSPNHPGARYNLANLDREEGRPAEAEQGYRRALDRRQDYPEARVALSTLLLDQGRYSEALTIIEPAIRAHPDLAEAWCARGRALAGVNRFAEGRDAVRRATELAPESADIWNSYGAALLAMGELDATEAALETALELEPDHRLAWGNRAALLELSSRLEECVELTEEGLKRWPEDVALSLTRARVQRRAGDPDSALAVLEPLTQADAPAQQRREVHFELGQTLDRLGRAEAAFEHYREGNRRAAEAWHAGDPRPDTYLPALRELNRAFTPGLVAAWPPPRPAAERPAFLVGFQRSGTTLLDTMLGAHPGVRVMEELPVVSAIIDRLARDHGPYPQALATLDAAAIEDLRATYWAKAAELSGLKVPGGFLLLDKSPLATAHLGLIERLFPGTPIVFMLRHPLDVVLSCFMQDFTMSPFMLNYTSIDGVAEVYREVMDLWLRYRDLLPLNVHQVRYEALVEAPEQEMRALLDFLGLPWDDAVMAHGRHAKDRGLINTPSYHQVTEPVYRRARDRWKRYRPQLESVIPLLEPYAKAFGYELT